MAKYLIYHYRKQFPNFDRELTLNYSKKEKRMWMECRDSNKEDISFNQYFICKSTPTIEDVIKKALFDHNMSETDFINSFNIN